MNRVNVQGDPGWAQFGQNIAGMFDPRAAAEGSALQARTKNFESEAKYNEARAGLLGDRRKALDPVALAAAGYTPRQISAITATQTDRMADWFSGVRADEGTQALLGGGDPRAAGILLNFAKAADKDFAPTNARADELNRQIAQNAIDLQSLKNSGALQIAQSRPVEVSPGATAIFAPGDPRNPSGLPKPLVYTPGSGMPPYRPGAMTSPSQLFTAPVAQPSVGASGSATGSSRVGNISADETELLNRIKIEEAGGKSLAGMAAYPISGGVALSDLVTSSARQAYPTDTPSVAISKWMAANGVTIENDWNAFSSNQSNLLKDGKPLTIADLIASGSTPAAAAPAISITPVAPAAPAAAAAAPESVAPVATPAISVAPAASDATTPAATATPAKPVEPGRTASGGIVIDGVPFEPSRTLAGERQHGDEYVGVNAKTKQLEARYWDANKGKWSKTPVFTGNGDAPDVARIKGDDTFMGVIPMNAEALRTAPGRLIEQGRAAGFIDEAKLAELMAADAKPSKGSYVDGGMPRTSAYLRSLAPQFNALYRAEAMKDPRIAKFAAGDFSGDAGLPDEAMALAEKIGINREQFGIPEAGIGESLPAGLGALFAPSGYGAAQESMPRGLQLFFQAIQEGRFDPNRLTVRPPAYNPGR